MTANEDIEFIKVSLDLLEKEIENEEKRLIQLYNRYDTAETDLESNLFTTRIGFKEKKINKLNRLKKNGQEWLEEISGSIKNV